jgi:hypothetical protein
MKEQELKENYPGVVDALEREFVDSEGRAETIESIVAVKVLASTINGGFVYHVSACEDFYVVEGETGTGIFCRDKDAAELNWGGAFE